MNFCKVQIRHSEDYAYFPVYKIIHIDEETGSVRYQTTENSPIWLMDKKDFVSFNGEFKNFFPKKSLEPVG